MILYVEGSLFNSPAQVLVNTVNTVGVMGKGIALEFKRLYPEMYRQYRSRCEAGQLSIGALWLYKSPNKWVLNFPTKTTWRLPSKMEYVDEGLRKFVDLYARLGIRSVAFPALGCGNGRLDFETQVRPLMERYLRYLPIEVFIYPDKPDLSWGGRKAIQEMRRWLRSQPTALQWGEVWHDLTELLDAKSAFRTPDGCEYDVSIAGAGGLCVTTESDEARQIERDALFAYWQQLCEHGFSTHRLATDLGSDVRFLKPLIAELPYVSQVKVATDYERFKTSQARRLQVMPRAFGLQSPVQQLPLFDA